MVKENISSETICFFLAFRMLPFFEIYLKVENMKAKENMKLNMMELISVGVNFLELILVLCVSKLRYLSAAAPH